jgi:hypothetical protein
MIERYTIKFGRAVSQKELEKALDELGDTPLDSGGLHRMKARIEIIADFGDLKKISEFIQRLKND